METRFLDPADDLVSVCSSTHPSVAPSQTQTLTQNTYAASLKERDGAAAAAAAVAERDGPGGALTAPAVAVAVAVLIPIFTFSVIPGFVGRMTVTSLVAGGVVGSLVQAGVLVAVQLFERDYLLCGGIYLGGMVMIATIM